MSIKQASPKSIHGDVKPFDEKRSWNYLLLLLSRQAYTEKQLRQKLYQRGVEKALADKLMLKLKDLSLLDDGLYAKQYIASRQYKKGPQVLRQELRRKGIAEKFIEQNLAELDSKSQVHAVKALLEKNLWRFKGDGFKKRQKAYAFLVRRGFGAEVVYEALEKFFAQD